MHSSSLPPQQVNTKQITHLTYQELDILHCLRGFCAFYVVIYHAKYILWSGGSQYLQEFPRASWNVGNYLLFALDMLSSAGFEMVIFFFVLSGFFIRYAQLRKYRQPIAFYINRIVRIYPPYLAASLLAATILLLLATQIPLALNTANNRELNISLAIAWQELQQFNMIGAIKLSLFIPVSKMYIGYNYVFWSLLPEGLFYLAVPLAFWRARTYYYFSIGLYIVGIFLQQQHIELNSVTLFLTTYNLYFAVGAILYDVVIGKTWLNWFRSVSGWLLIIICGILFVSLLGLAIIKLRIVSGVVASVLATISVSALLAGRVSRQNFLVRLLHTIGVFSFSLYLYHIPLLLLCYGGLVYFTGETVFYARYYWLAVPIVTFASYGLYWITERVSVNYFRRV